MRDALFERYLRNELDDDGARALAAILDTDQGARDFAAFVQEWTLLGEAARQRVSEAGRPRVKKLRLRSPAPGVHRSALAWIAGVASAAAFMLALALPSQEYRRPDPVVAKAGPTPTSPVEPAPADPAKQTPSPAPPLVPAPPSLPPPSQPAAPPEPAPPLEPVASVAPSRAPEKAPEVRPNEPSKVALAPVALLVRVNGDAFVGAARKKAIAGEGLAAEESLECARGAQVLLEYPDGTRMDLAAETLVDRIAERSGRKTLHLTRGSVSASVARQPAGRSVSVWTPHGEALVLGTQFTVTATADATKVEVREGRVRLIRPEASVEISAAHFAVAAKGVKMESKPILFTRSFQDGPGYAGTRDTEISGAEPSRAFGSEEVLEADGDEVEKKKIYALIRWDLSELPPNAVIRSAVITLHVTNESLGAGYSFYELKRAWSEAEATWKQADAQQAWRSAGARSTLERGVEVLGTVAPRQKGELKILLAPAGEAQIQSWIRLPAGNHGMILANDNNSDGFKFCSRESSVHDRRPKLTLTYTLTGK